MKEKNREKKSTRQMVTLGLAFISASERLTMSLPENKHGKFLPLIADPTNALGGDTSGNPQIMFRRYNFRIGTHWRHTDIYPAKRCGRRCMQSMEDRNIQVLCDLVELVQTYHHVSEEYSPRNRAHAGTASAKKRYLPNGVHHFCKQETPARPPLLHDLTSQACPYWSLLVRCY